jgi:hypothetical protein
MSGELRASDADRERVVEQLRAHAGEGRLDLDELERRTEAALSARTQGELAVLVGDLPARAAPHGRGRRARGPELGAFVAVQVVLVVVWALTGMGYFWPVWPLLGWGVPLLLGAKGRPLRFN